MKWRKLTAGEEGLLGALLAVDFPGRDELRVQAKTARVQPLDDEGSLEFQKGSGPAADVLEECPVDATGVDQDGVVINAFLHVVDGHLHELEILKVDGSPLRRIPPPGEWDVVALG